MGHITGPIYCLLWYCSILAGYAGFCPLLLVIFISNKFYRYLTDVLFTFWQHYPTVLLEYLCKCEVQISGDPILSGETSLVIMNHRTRTDWNFLWPAAYHCVVGADKYRHPIKFVLKDLIRHIPGPGWVMQLAFCIYIKRCWRFDEGTFQKAINYFSAISYKYTLLVFPEGTDLTESTKITSDKYAEKHHLEKYQYVLHPRTTGFAFIASRLLSQKNLDAVYDVTLVYPDTIPQSEISLLKGDFPRMVRIHLTRYPASVLPKKSDELKHFLEERWREKEKILKEYYATGNFLHGNLLRRKNSLVLHAALVFWTLLPFVVIYLLLNFWWFRCLVIVHTILLLFINLTMDGFQHFETWLYWFKRKVFSSFF